MLTDRASMFCNVSRETPRCLNGFDVSQSRQVRVLISHSDPIVSAGLEAALQKRQDLKVVVARFGSECAYEIERKSAEADVVITDYGSWLRLRKIASELDNRVMIFTHSDGEARIRRALESGVRGYLLLDCSPDDLVEGIRSVYHGGISLAPLVARRIAENMTQPALTEREEFVLRQLVSGLSNKRIAAKCTLAESTIKTYIKSIFVKLDAANRAEAIAIVHRRGLLALESQET